MWDRSFFFFFSSINQTTENTHFLFHFPSLSPFSIPPFSRQPNTSPRSKGKRNYIWFFFFGFSSVTITCMLPTTASNGRLTNLKDLRIKNISIWCKYIPQNRRSIMLNSPRNVMYTWTKFIYELTKDILIYTTATNSITVITEMV